jgi:hypothetical protein
MNRLTLVLAATLPALGACSSRASLPVSPAGITLLADRGRLETWEARSLAHGHLHARGPDDGGCAALAEMVRVMTVLSSGVEGERAESVRNTGEAMAALVEGMCVTMFGRGYGGKGRLALALRPPGGEGEALFVVVPALAAGESDRTFRTGEILAEFLAPLGRVEAALESGRVRVRRGEASGTEFELFLVLRPAAAGAAYERLQVVARTETPAGR